MCRKDVSVPEKTPTHFTREAKGAELLVKNYQSEHEEKHVSSVITSGQRAH